MADWEPGDRMTVRTELTLPSGMKIVRVMPPDGPLTRSVLQAMHMALASHDPSVGLLLASHQPQLPDLPPLAQAEWVQWAGACRRRQEQLKRHGCLMVSWVSGMLLGGIYMIHGMAAPIRLLAADAQVYPALPKASYEARFGQPYPHPSDAATALKTGLVTALCEGADAWQQAFEPEAQ